MMDDHVLRWNRGWGYPMRNFEDEFRFHLRNAYKVFVISPAMQQFYKDKFGVESDVLFAPADTINGPVWQSPTPGETVRLAYFGSIWPWQRDALARLVSHLAPIDATLDVFGFHALPPELRLPRVCVRPPVPAKDVMPRMREYDGVVIPAGFTDEMRNLSELNISSKLSESLACGTVPVIVAPEFAAMVKFARKYGGAVVLSDFDAPEQLNAIRSLKSANFRSRVLAEARRVVDKECSSEVMRGRWIRAWHDCGEQTSHDLPVPENDPVRVLSGLDADIQPFS
jgi:glycosyltransferase involved in cell wall biosynthesis